MSPIATAGFRPDFDSVAVFTDFDGTLVDLAPTPDSITVPRGLGKTLSALDSRLKHAFAIVTGRPIAEIERFLAPEKLAIAGAHGAERRHADGRYEGPPPAVVAAAEAIAARLELLRREEPMLLIETKPGTVAIHYRLAPQWEARCRAAMAEAVRPYPEFTVIAGKMVLEARPRSVGKGEAVRSFMAEAPFAGRWPLFIGDDTTDEDGFAAAEALGGAGVKIGPGESRASLRLPGPQAVLGLLDDLASGRNDDAAARLYDPELLENTRP